MTLVTRAIPGLFGGVSQQVPAMRHSTHCEEQLNAVSTLVDGLYKRPGTTHIKQLALTGANGASVAGSGGVAFAHVIDRGPAKQHVLVLVNGNMMLYDILTGAAQTVAFPDGKTYLNTAAAESDFRCVSVADYTFVLNRSKVVTTKPAADSPNPINVVYVYVRTAVPSIDYKVNIDGTLVTVSTGTTPATDDIASDIRSGLATGLGGGYTVTLVAGTDIVKVVKTAGTAMTCVVSDGWGNTCLQPLHDGVPKYADLPPKFETGFAIGITGTAATATDTYYVKWDGKAYVETKKPGIIDTLDETTMPHQLRPDGLGNWVFEKVGTWDTRKVGDDNTNPLPSFVDTKVRDIFFFRNRLGFLAADNVVMSRAGEYFAFFAKTATQVLDSDPIDLGAPTEDINTLDWAVAFNQNLLVFADGRQQFILTSGDLLTPESARLMPTTTFETYNGVKPRALGNKVVFASTKGSFSQMSLYGVSEDTVTNVAEDFTEHVPRYIPATPRHIETSSVAKAVVAVPRGVRNTLPFLKYELNPNGSLSQKAWSVFSFNVQGSMRIIKAHWDSRQLFLLFYKATTGDSEPGRFVLEVFNFPMEGTEDLEVPEALRLDGRVQPTWVSFDGTHSYVKVPYLYPAGMRVINFEAGTEPTEIPVELHTMNTGTGETTLKLLGDYTGAALYAGRSFPFRYVFTEVFLRDSDSVPIIASSVKLVRMLVRYVDTGYATATVQLPLRDPYTYTLVGRNVGLPGQGAGQLSLSTGTFPIPVHSKATGVRITLESNSYLPCKFPYAEWVGDVVMKAQR